jgi:hypothetical protein
MKISPQSSKSEEVYHDQNRINFIGWNIFIFIQLVKGLKDGPHSIFIGPSKSKE